MRRLADPAVAARLLAAGGVVLLATDTLPGLHCRADDGGALARLLAIKARDPRKPLLLLCADATQALGLAMPLSGPVAAYARRCWPGPHTLVLPRGDAGDYQRKARRDSPVFPTTTLCVREAPRAVAVTA